MIRAKVIELCRGGERLDRGWQLFAVAPGPGDRVTFLHPDGGQDGIELEVTQIQHFVTVDTGDKAPGLLVYGRAWIGPNRHSPDTGGFAASIALLTASATANCRRCGQRRG